MSSTHCVEQKGIIENIKNGIAEINITSFSACSACESKSACQISESATKIIKVPVEKNEYKKGDTVRVLMKKTLGIRATLLAYIFPFIIIIFSLIILTSTGISEWLSGVISLLLLVPYYTILFLFRSSLQKTFQFTLNKVV